MTAEVAIDGNLKTVNGIDGLRIMLRQICMDYSSLPPLDKITADQIEFFYNPLIPGLLKTQQAAKK